MSLERHQRHLRAALRGDMPPATSSGYVQAVSRSPEWRLLRQSIEFWRTLAVVRGAPLTSELLRRQGRLEGYVRALIAGGRASPFTELMARRLLRATARDPDLSVREVGRFERLMRHIAAGRLQGVEIVGYCDPQIFVPALLDVTHPRSSFVSHGETGVRLEHRTDTTRLVVRRLDRLPTSTTRWWRVGPEQR